MTYRGQVKNGVIVLDGAMPLEEGTLVRVEPVGASRESTRPSRGKLNWVGPAGELQRLLDEVQEMRDQDLKLQEEHGQ